MSYGKGRACVLAAIVVLAAVGGCRTNVEITINELEDACDVKGHHNVLFYGDYAKRLHQFAQLYGIKVVT